MGNVQERLKGRTKAIHGFASSPLYTPTPVDIDVVAQQRVYVSPNLKKEFIGVLYQRLRLYDASHFGVWRQ